MSSIFEVKGEFSKIPFRRKWQFSPAQELLHRLYPDLPEYNEPDQFKDYYYADWIPLVDLIDSSDSFIIKVELPGINKNDVSLSIHNNELWIQGDRRLEKEVSLNYYFCEGNYGTFLRRIKLPEYDSLSDIKSELRNGILTITISKNKKMKIRNIEIK